MSSERNIFPDRQTTRLRWFDYSEANFYFVTICTYRGEHIFGGINNGEMTLNADGLRAYAEWLRLPERYPGIALDDFIFMPNHMHGIIVIYGKLNLENVPERFRKQRLLMLSTYHPELNNYKAPPLWEIVRGYKGSTSHNIHTSGTTNFAWHTRYHEIIIRDQKHLHTLRNYISRNPETWKSDKLYTPKKYK
jgi:putative transposase